MKKHNYSSKSKNKSNVSVFGALMFFGLIAITMQIAILVYDYIISRTDSKNLIALLILILIVILSTVCLLIDLIRRKITVDKPVEMILDATDKIAHGDFSVRVMPIHAYERYNQYDIIMENLNKMAQELEKSEILKVDFISNVSHEIKTPLSVIKSYSNLLQDKSLGEEEKQKYAKIILGATTKLNDLITNILKLNKLENQELSPELTKICLNAQLEEIIISYEELLDKKELVLECDLEELYITSCQPYLEIVWSNLLSNAIKFTEKGGKITVLARRDGKCAIVSVSDTGCGIDSQSGQRIFDKFYQADTSHQSQGNGLGLALVKRVINILGGEISVESTLNEGSTFTVVLKDVIDE